MVGVEEVGMRLFVRLPTNTDFSDKIPGLIQKINSMLTPGDSRYFACRFKIERKHV